MPFRWSAAQTGHHHVITRGSIRVQRPPARRLAGPGAQRAQGEPAAVRPRRETGRAQLSLSKSKVHPGDAVTGFLFTQQMTPGLGAAPAREPPRAQRGGARPPGAGTPASWVQRLPRGPRLQWPHQAARGVAAATASSSDSPGRSCWRKTPATRTASPVHGAAGGRRSRGFCRARRRLCQSGSPG